MNSPTRLTVVSPAGAGTIDVTVSDAVGTSAVVIADQLTYIPYPGQCREGFYRIYGSYGCVAVTGLEWVDPP